MVVALEIRGCGAGSYVIVQGQQKVAGPYTSHNNATAALTGVEQRLNPLQARFRKCCRCREGFMALGRASCCDRCLRGPRQ